MSSEEKNKEKGKELVAKIMKYTGKIGEKTAYYSLLLYYAAKSPSIPKSSKMIIVGALAYFILPVDLIPDFIPVVGLADDSAVIAAAVYKIMTHVDANMKEKAREKVQYIFK